MQRLKFNIVRSKSSIVTLLVITFLIMLSHIADAQVAIGPKAGVSVTMLSGSDLQDIHAKTSFVGGVFLNIQAARWFTIQPEGLISQKGATYTKNGTRTEMKLSYFEVPILAKFRLPIDKVFYPHFLVGPNIAFNTNAKYVATDTQSGTVVQGDGSDINKTDIGALVGAGLDIQSKRLFVTIDGRYGYAFNNLNNNSAYVIHNTGWTFTAGVGLRLFTDNDD